MKPTFQILAALAIAFLCAFELIGCGREAATENVPINEVDLRINEYEKVANEYGRVARKLKAGDVSLTIRYLDLGKRTQEAAAKVQQESPRMTPPQAHRVAAISARTAPYFH